MTVYVLTCNSDNRLDQKDWSWFTEMIGFAVIGYSSHVHFRGYTESAAVDQKMAIIFEPLEQYIEPMQARLRELAAEYGQDSIIWADVPSVTYLVTEHHPATAMLDSLHNQNYVTRERPQRRGDGSGQAGEAGAGD